jgi:glycosyltransferase involved in cell wall biosynthesis
VNVSVLILTFNEEANLPDCLVSVAWSDDIVVFDSFSSDRTIEIAQASGARVVQRLFDNYAAQRNAALNEVSYRHPWVLMLDADERATPALSREIETVLAKASEDMDLFRVRRQDFLLGHWFKRSSGYPTWFGRLIRVGHVEVKREINEEYHTNGKVGFLSEHLVHYPFNKGIAHWYERHNRYSSMEAGALAEEIQGYWSWRRLIVRGPVTRRKALKQLAYRLPGRPLLVFFYLYFIRLGFLDGRTGIIYCTLRALYELMIDLKALEIHRRKRGLPI